MSATNSDDSKRALGIQWLGKWGFQLFLGGGTALSLALTFQVLPGSVSAGQPDSLPAPEGVGWVGLFISAALFLATLKSFFVAQENANSERSSRMDEVLGKTEKHLVRQIVHTGHSNSPIEQVAATNAKVTALDKAVRPFFSELLQLLSDEEWSNGANFLERHQVWRIRCRPRGVFLSRVFKRLFENFVDRETVFRTVTNAAFWSARALGKYPSAQHPDAYAFDADKACKDNRIRIRRVMLVPSLSILEQWADRLLSNRHRLLATLAKSDIPGVTEEMLLLGHMCDIRNMLALNMPNRVATDEAGTELLLVEVEEPSLYESLFIHVKEADYETSENFAVWTYRKQLIGLSVSYADMTRFGVSSVAYLANEIKLRRLDERFKHRVNEAREQDRRWRGADGGSDRLVSYQSGVNQLLESLAEIRNPDV